MCFNCNSQHKLVIDCSKIATKYFQEDAKWYIDNIPFFECSDKQLEQVYYYRWKMYKAHIRNVGKDGFVITEFINHVSWDRDPYCTINAASMHHIYEGRWLRDDRYLNGYINYLYQQGGNDRRYSESIADAAYARFLVNADTGFIVRHLDSMLQKFDAWADHYDSSKNLYYIPAMPDATEYNIAAIDASGGKDGFEGGEAFRPTINSYMYGNAVAIARIANLKGKPAIEKEYAQRAADLQNNVERNLWNDSLQHFTDRFKVDNQYVRYWDFIRGRELAGMAPWYFNLPSQNPVFNASWMQVIDTNRLIGQYGFRTNEPAYEYYFKQFLYYQGQRGSQWNGPSWPYQSSIALTGMANLLNNYNQSIVSKNDYTKLLKLFALQHYLPDGKLNLVENYDPNLGGPIVYYYWSNHYNHSSFNNLVITGFCGVRPSESDTLNINPLISDTTEYFCLANLPYHGHSITMVYDKNGTKYKKGKGLFVWVDGVKTNTWKQAGKTVVLIGKPTVKPLIGQPENKALNIYLKGYPMPSASVNNVPDSLYQALDGRIWYFPEITNYWSTLGSTSATDWFAIEFGKATNISSIKLYPYTDGKAFALPDNYTIEYKSNNNWRAVRIKNANGKKLTGNTVNEVRFDEIDANEIRLKFTHTAKQIAFAEIECY